MEEVREIKTEVLDELDGEYTPMEAYDAFRTNCTRTWLRYRGYLSYVLTKINLKTITKK